MASNTYMTNKTVFRSKSVCFRAKKTAPIVLLEACRAFFKEIKRNPNLVYKLENMRVLETFSHYIFSPDTKLSDYNILDIVSKNFYGIVVAIFFLSE